MQQFMNASQVDGLPDDEVSLIASQKQLEECSKQLIDLKSQKEQLNREIQRVEE